MIIPAGKTANFAIEYDSEFGDALRRAQALLSSCEADFAQLRGWFTSTGGFGPSNRITVFVTSYGGGGINFRYQTDGTTKVIVDAFDGSPDKELADDATRAVFVAEVAEVLMGHQNFATGTTTWHPGWSDGEGLSRVSAELLYNDACYQLLGGEPWANTWFQSTTRSDFVTVPAQTDLNLNSIGCSIIFIYYLYSQLGFDMRSIVSKAGATLEATYGALTGSSGGYEALTSLLSRFFPIAEGRSLSFDNLFPLLDGNQRTVSVTMSEAPEIAPKVIRSGSATISAGGKCAKKTYAWTISNVSQELTCTASTVGFGQPQFNWKINGVLLSGLGTIDVTATVDVDNPDDPDQPFSAKQQVSIFYSTSPEISYKGVFGELAIFNQSFPGHILLVVEADVSEGAASSDVTAGTALGTLDSQVLIYEDQYYKDRAACLIHVLTELEVRQPLAEWLYVLLTLPDPPSEVMNGARVLVAVVQEIVAISATRPAVGRQVASAVARVLNVPVNMLLTGTPTAEQ